jgi:hypothetical protein
MEKYCSTGQSPQRDVAPMEEEEDTQENCFKRNIKIYIKTAATCFDVITIIRERSI